MTAWLPAPSRLGTALHVAIWLLAAVAGVAVADPSEFRPPPMTTEQIDAALLRWTAVAPRHRLRRSPTYRAAVVAAVEDGAVKHGLRRSLVLAIIMRESSGRDDVTGPAGERGLMQVHPMTAVHWRCRLETPAQQVDCGCRILAHHVARCGGSERGGVSAYGSRSGACRPPPGGSVDRMARDRVALADRIRREAQQMKEVQ